MIDLYGTVERNKVPAPVDGDTFTNWSSANLVAGITDYPGTFIEIPAASLTQAKRDKSK